MPSPSWFVASYYGAVSVSELGVNGVASGVRCGMPMTYDSRDS